ncbi:hypothetical protein TrVE_jg752 [Triparma verrucosa]|uniref:Uncharacterized protein n=1 Tax=Triparma verrucosa TaxID=1606542 RepID=A0A9W7FBX9_9STRA|nr:hypothetical protein TrVE_jg752 [Triparma verrucosa]
MGSWFSKPKCTYKRGWSKSNACPPGFTTKESCGRWSSTISCSWNGNKGSGVPVSPLSYRTGSCTSDSKHPENGGTTPPSISCSGGDVEASSGFVACCNGASACTSSNTVGWAKRVTCANSSGDYVFDVSGPNDCASKQGGRSNNFPAQAWCKSANQGAYSCWLPYSMNADGKCFAYGDMQWNSATDTYGAKTKIGGSKILLNGADNFVQSTGAQVAPITSYNSGSIAGTSAGGFACVVGVGALFRKKQQKRSAGKASNVELKEGANAV